MKDPLAEIMQWYFGLFHFGGFGGVVVQISIVCMILAITRRSVMMAIIRAREKNVARFGMAVVGEVNALLPEYEKTLNEYVAMVDEKVGHHPSLVAMAQSIDRDVKVKAERDFCALDVGRPETVAILSLQLAQMLNNNSNAKATRGDSR